MPCRWASVLAAKGAHSPRRILTSARALSVANNQSSGRSAAVARLLWEQDVAGSNPAAPTTEDGAHGAQAVLKTVPARDGRWFDSIIFRHCT